jgi:hypothetical protein
VRWIKETGEEKRAEKALYFSNFFMTVTAYSQEAAYTVLRLYIKHWGLKKQALLDIVFHVLILNKDIKFYLTALKMKKTKLIF